MRRKEKTERDSEYITYKRIYPRNGAYSGLLLVRGERKVHLEVCQYLYIYIYSGFRLGEKILFSGSISSINCDPFPWSFQTEAIPKCCKAFLKCLSILRNTPKAKLKLNSTNSQLRMQASAIPMVFHDAGVMSMWEFHRNI